MGGADLAALSSHPKVEVVALCYVDAGNLAAAAANPAIVTQMGTQIHSNTQYRTAVRLVQRGIIGKVREVCSWSRKTWGYDGPQPEPGPVPASFDWNLWLGTAADRAFCPGHYHPGNWRRWYDFGGGTMGDMAIHILDPVFSGLQLGPPRSLLSNSSRPPADSFGMRNETRFTFPAGKYTTDGFVLT